MGHPDTPTPEPELEHLLQEFAEKVMDHLNTEAETADAPAMLTSYVFTLEGNGWTADGEPISRSTMMSLGSSSQVKGLLVETLDDLRNMDLRGELEEGGR